MRRDVSGPPVRGSDQRRHNNQAVDNRKAGAEVAADYTNRIDKKLATLSIFPNKGTPRPDFSPGCRSTTFERRYLIVYRIMDDFVRVERIVDGYRDWEWLK